MWGKWAYISMRKTLVDVAPHRAHVTSDRKTPRKQKKEFKGEIWEEWSLTYGRNGVE